MKEVERAWLAGITDGEGTITLSYISNRNLTCLQFSIGMTHKETIKTVRRFFGFGKLYEYRKKDRQIIHKWTVSGKEAAYAIKQIKDYLVTKKEQALVAIEFSEKCITGPGVWHTEEVKQLAHEFLIRMYKLNLRGT